MKDYIRLDISHMSDQELDEMFRTAFENQIAQVYKIEEFDVKCERVPLTQRVVATVNISGFADTPTADQYSSNTLRNVEYVEIQDPMGSLYFKLNDGKKVTLGGIDYQVVYESI